MKRYVLIVAGGRGVRMGSELPKQFLPIGGKPVLMRTLERFCHYDREMGLVLVLPVAWQSRWTELCEEYSFRIPHTVADGGETRFHSVKNGLAKIDVAEEEALIAIHDGVRPFVSEEVIAACFRRAAEKGAVIPVVGMVESLRRVTAEESVAEDRGAYRIVQTPQVFRADWLREAYDLPYSPSFTDDASVVEASGRKVWLVEGNRENIKITTPFDLKVANALV